MSSNCSTYNKSYGYDGIRRRTSVSHANNSRSEAAVDVMKNKFNFAITSMAAVSISMVMAWGGIFSLSHLDAKAMTVSDMTPKELPDSNVNTIENGIDNLGKAFAQTAEKVPANSQVAAAAEAMPKDKENIASRIAAAAMAAVSNEVTFYRADDADTDQSVTISEPETSVQDDVTKVAKTVEKAIYDNIIPESDPRFDEAEAAARDYIYQHESSNKLTAVNRSSGACGIGQSNPCKYLAKACPDYKHDRACQEEFFEDYMKYRYGTWQKAKQHWDAKVPVYDPYNKKMLHVNWW